MNIMKIYNSEATHDAGNTGWKTVALDPSFVLQSPPPTLYMPCQQIRARAKEKACLPVITGRKKYRSSSCAKSRKEGTYLFSVVSRNLEST